MTSETLTVEEALLRAEQIDRNLDAFDETAPNRPLKNPPPTPALAATI